jgi:transcriptional regulator with XRE-family HTH domain
MDTLEYQQVVGRRIAAERRRHGLSQPELAALLDRPVAWISQLERGAAPIDCPEALATVADALELPLTELTCLGTGPAPPAPGEQATPGQPAPAGKAAASLRVLLAGAHSLQAMLGEQVPASPAWLRMQTDQACALARAGRYADLRGQLAVLLPALEVAVRRLPAAEQPDAFELAAVAYQACSAALARLGDADAAWIAADRAMAAAERAGNLLLVAAGAHRLASVFLGTGGYALAEETAQTSITALHGLTQLGDPEAVALSGGLTLLRAAVAARAGHQSIAYRHLARARQLAAQLGPQRSGGAPEFGPEYVALYEIAVSVDLGDAGHALRVAARADITGLSPGRQARMLIDVARAHALRGQAEEAATALGKAEAIGGGYLASSDRAREVVRRLLGSGGPVPAAIAGLAARLAVPQDD